MQRRARLLGNCHNAACSYMTLKDLVSSAKLHHKDDVKSFDIVCYCFGLRVCIDDVQCCNNKKTKPSSTILTLILSCFALLDPGEADDLCFSFVAHQCVLCSLEGQSLLLMWKQLP